MALKLIIAPALLPITVAEAKAHLRVDVSDDDTLITAYITAAAQLAEQATGRALLPQTWEITLDAFPDAFELTRTPVTSITSLIYADATGTDITLSNTLYTLDTADEFGPAYCVPAYGTTWPATRDQVNAVRLRFVAGWADAASVPESVKAWVKLMVGAMYENREAEGARQTHTLGYADRLLDRYKLWHA